MRKPLFTGVCTALVTPFKNSQINYEMLAKLLLRQTNAGIQAVVLAGTTGESPTLRDAEKITLYKEGKQFMDNKCLMIAGTGSNDTSHCIELSIAAEEAGADGLLIVSPYYNKATPTGICKHYEAICNAVTLPVIVYNVPSRTGLDIPVKVYEELARIPNIAGIKEASGDISKISRIINACGSDFPIWSGNDDQIVPVMSLGGKGVISVLSNIAPEQTSTMCMHALNGNYSEAAKMQCAFLPLIDYLFCEVNPIPVKALLNELGYDCGDCRLPLDGLSQENIKVMKAFAQ